MPGLGPGAREPGDRRARRIRFTPTGLDWLVAFQDAIERAEAEARAGWATTC